MAKDVALIFPGQGAQSVGMGRDFYEQSPEAKAVFDQADRVLNNGLLDVMFNGPAERLITTAYCQPAILTMCVAALRALQAHPKYAQMTPQFAAGLSLGEYAALAASGALSFEDTLRLVERRSFFMEEATKLHQGKMAAVIGLDKEKIVALCKEAGAEVANFNSPQQTVITGHADKVGAACAALKAAGAKSVVPLEVSGAFHSSLMKSAADQFIEVLAEVDFDAPEIPVVGNVNGMSASNAIYLRKNLAKQITSSVQWVDSVNYIAEQGVEDFIEIGPGKVLKGLIRRINPDLRVHNIETPADIDALPF